MGVLPHVTLCGKAIWRRKVCCLKWRSSVSRDLTLGVSRRLREIPSIILKAVTRLIIRHRVFKFVRVKHCTCVWSCTIRLQARVLGEMSNFILTPTGGRPRVRSGQYYPRKSVNIISRKGFRVTTHINILSPQWMAINRNGKFIYTSVSEKLYHIFMRKLMIPI